MRLGWRIPLPGPFTLGGTIWRSHYRRKYRVMNCGHAHRTQAAYDRCPYRGQYPVVEKGTIAILRQRRRNKQARG